MSIELLWTYHKECRIYFWGAGGFTINVVVEQNYVTDNKLHLYQYLLRRASLTERDAFAFLKVDNEDCITYSGFCEALKQVCCSIDCRISTLKFQLVLGNCD